MLSLSTEHAQCFSSIHDVIYKSIASGGRLYIAGNGGSAADSQHIAAEFVCRLSSDRSPYPAEALTVDSSVLTAIANDYGYQSVFARQLACKLRPDDVFLAISTSGDSQNIYQALLECQSHSCNSVLLTGKTGGICSQIADHVFLVPSSDTCLIQEVHISFLHLLCFCVERSLS